MYTVHPWVRGTDVAWVPHRDHYFTDVGWVDEESVAVVWRNRAQNVSVITACRAPLWYCDEVSVSPCCCSSFRSYKCYLRSTI